MNDRVRAALGSPFLIFSLLMTAKFYLVSAVIWDSGPWNPLLTSLPSVWAAFALIELIADKRKVAAYAAVNLIYTCVYFAVVMYYKYFGIIVTYHAVSQVGQVTEVKGSVFQLMHPYFLLIFTDLLVMAALTAWHGGFRRWASRPKPSGAYRAGAAVFAALMIGICLAQTIPNRDIVNELQRAERMGIINYEIDVMFGPAQGPSIDPSAINPGAVREVKRLDDRPTPEWWRAAEGRHVLFVQLEAFQSLLIGLEAGGVEVTPVLNALMEESIYFPRIYQQVGAGNTSDAEFVANTSLLTPPAGAASESYAGKALPSLAKRLHTKGYVSATFHTNDVNFWNRDELYEAIGFDRYYDQSFFADEDLVHFGSSDEVLYRRTVDELIELTESGKRVFANIISMSAHHPFNLPEHKSTLELPERFDGTFVGDYLRSQHYADAALGLFIERLKAAGLWENSLLVIYGDHMGMPVYSLTKEDRELLDELLGKEYGYAEMLNVPLMITAPGSKLQPKVLRQVGGHSDIMPTVANLVGVSLTDAVVFGQDLLNHQRNLLPIRYYLPSGSFINDRAIFVPGEAYADGIAYPLDGSPAVRLEELANPRALATEDEFRRALDLFRISHTYITNLPDRTP